MITTDMSSWGWSSWLLFSVFLLVAATFGFVLRDLIQQKRDKMPKKIDFGEPFTLTMGNYPQFIGRFVTIHKELNRGTFIEAVDEYTYRQSHRIDPSADS